MRQIFLFSAIALTRIAPAQTTGWQNILTTDPHMANGYFIVDEAKRERLGVARVDIDILLHEPNGNGYHTTTVQHLTIVPPEFQAHVDFSLFQPVDPGVQVSYHLNGITNKGDIIVEAGECAGCVGAEEVCRVTCDAPAYAWSLVTMANPYYSTISLYEGTINGSYFYFYVDDGNWNAFKLQFPNCSVFGLAGNWSDYPNTNSEDVIQLDYIGDDFRDYEGFPLTPSETHGCYGIRKDMGPWRDFFAEIDSLAGDPSDYCEGVNPGIQLALFNSDSIIHIQLVQHGLPSLNCQGMYELGGGMDWGDGSGTICTQISYEDTIGGDADLAGWVMEAIDCPELGEVPSEPEAVSEVIVHHILPGQTTAVLSVPFPDESDPKLIPIRRTTLTPGLYRFTIVFDNGRILRHYQSFDHGVTLSASFADFTEVAVYPVPIAGTTFSIDFETLAPLDVDITVINNQGTVYYQKSDSFTEVGRNKHVVTMQNLWPSGLYHVIISYQDGSSESIGVTVQ